MVMLANQAIDVNIKDADGMTALLHTVTTQKMNVMHLLL
jgi:ankyrin repeat protein